jgi:hypothetical protein
MNELGGYAFDDLRVGMWAMFAKTITEADIVLFTAVSGDNNLAEIKPAPKFNRNRSRDKAVYDYYHTPLWY